MYKPGSDPHLLAFLRVNGTLHPWQERLREDWKAESVRETELVVVVGTPVKRFINRIDYPGGAPPIDRYVFELEISVIEAKTGKILNNRLFRNMPRPIQRHGGVGDDDHRPDCFAPAGIQLRVAAEQGGFPRSARSDADRHADGLTLSVYV